LQPASNENVANAVNARETRCERFMGKTERLCREKFASLHPDNKKP